MDERPIDPINLLRRAGWLLLAPFRLAGRALRLCFRAGLFFLFYAPVALRGMLFLVCAGIVIAAVVYQIIRPDPASDRQNHAWVQKTQHDIAVHRAAAGAPPLWPDPTVRQADKVPKTP